MEKELKVGDKIRIDTAFSSKTVEIVRVTKTMAMTKPSASGYTMRFKIKTWFGSPRLVNGDTWSTTRYTLI